MAWTMIGALALGSTWRQTMRRAGTPTVRAAAMYCSSSMVSTMERHPGEIVDEGPRDGDDDVQKSGTEHGHRIDGDDEIGEGPLQIGVAHDDVVDPAAEIAGDETERDADHRCDDHRRDAHEQRDPGAGDDAAREIATEIVGRQRMGRQARHRHLAQHVVGVAGREKRAEQGGQHEQGKGRHPRHRLLVAHQHAPELAPAGPPRRQRPAFVGQGAGGHRSYRMRGSISA